ncbi:MAG: carbohydrate-binding domain-containing protein [Anaerolineae bacterium]|nr:carbohydrate-binding domain-containing protein [Anaerolineae bacterium]
MGKHKMALLLACALVLSMLTACGASQQPALSDIEQAGNSEASTGTETVAAANAVMVTTIKSDQGDEGTEADSVAEAVTANKRDHGDAEDYAWDSSGAIQIALQGDSITADGASVTIDGSRATITSAGTYVISGSLADGQIIVNSQEDGIVRLVLDGVDISSSTGAPIYVMSADEAIIVLGDNTENSVSDGASYVVGDAEEDAPNAAIFSMADLTIYGNGSLAVDGNYNDGIASKDGLIIAGGTLAVGAVDDGIRGKDYVVVKGGDITVDAQGDGLKSDNEEDATKGYVLVEGGAIHVTSGNDAIEGQTDVLIAGGEIVVIAGGGSEGRIGESASAKGILAAVSVNIDGGTITISSADDAIHSNGSLTINGGTFILSTGDDAMHADSTLKINGGEISITDSFEGLESAIITINDGDIHIVSSDDGINVASGNDGSGMNFGPGRGGRPGGGPGQDAFAASGSYYLAINGGYVYVDADGDGIDANGYIEMTDGVVIVNGPTENMNGALDYISGFEISGGFLVAVGSAGMAQAPDQSSSQYSLLLNLNSTLRAGTLIHIQSSDGEEILTFVPSKQYQSIAFSSPKLASGSTYEVYYGGNSTGTATDGLYQGGTVSSATALGSFTVSSIVTAIGRSSRW